ncbi:hypothetical protein SAMN02745150_00572 [Brevinema andersonii]|uniref:Uncharacterized protein n=1 Tax=Brevinema andersonii TaxID=34097 RepID=A0A1I1DIM9_BREAD|nr:hypothetical protein [Brevinema andersonii]SFB74727.1 hypothetical protein SAMN02745150_00572 [Brevinema andersonii]
MVIPIYTQQTPATPRPQAQRRVQHRLSILTAMLVQNAPIAELATFQVNRTWYARQFDVWKTGSAGMGLSIGLGYDLQGRRGAMFRMQAMLESTGWVMGVFDIGTGIRTPIGKKGVRFSTEVYFSMAVTGGNLGIVGTAPISQLSSLSTSVGLFGFKGRLALEVPINKKLFLTSYISYASYPWRHASTRAEYLINGSASGVSIDGLQIGFEFGSKF